MDKEYGILFVPDAVPYQTILAKSDVIQILFTIGLKAIGGMDYRLILV
jgi:hypothetical protein